MTEKMKYWVWLSLAMERPTVRHRELLQSYPDPEVIYNMTDSERKMTGLFTNHRLQKLKATKLDAALPIVEQCSKNGWKIITPDSDHYSRLLGSIKNMPTLLYADGNIDLLREPVKIAVVGTRRPCMDSVKIAEQMATDLARAGAVVVSGGAEGIDCAAHRGTMNENRRTIAVLGCGLAASHMSYDRPLRQRLHEGALVITEYSPNFRASSKTYPERNRIISGVSRGVLVVEAATESGSLITAEHARVQGREIYAIPGSILNARYEGANNLIRDGKARPIFGADDILEGFSKRFPNDITLGMSKPFSEKNAKNVPKAPEHLSDSAKKVFETLAKAFKNGVEKLAIDEICDQCGLPMSKTSAALIELELEDLVESYAGKEYKLK